VSLPRDRYRLERAALTRRVPRRSARSFALFPQSRTTADEAFQLLPRALKAAAKRPTARSPPAPSVGSVIIVALALSLSYECGRTPRQAPPLAAPSLVTRQDTSRSSLIWLRWARPVTGSGGGWSERLARLSLNYCEERAFALFLSRVLATSRSARRDAPAIAAGARRIVPSRLLDGEFRSRVGVSLVSEARWSSVSRVVVKRAGPRCPSPFRDRLWAAVVAAPERLSAGRAECSTPDLSQPLVHHLIRRDRRRLVSVRRLHEPRCVRVGGDRGLRSACSACLFQASPRSWD